MKKTLLFTTSLLFCLCVHAQNKKELLEIEQQLVQDSATLVKKQEQLSSNVKKIESEISTLRSQIQHIDGRIDAERPIRAQHEDSIAFYHKSFLELERQKDSLQVLLEQLSKTQIFLDCETPGAEMFVDGKNVGKAPCSVSVEYGSHTFSAKKDGLEEYLEVTVYHEGQRKWKLPVIYTEIIIKCATAGATIYVDNKYVGVAPCKLPITFEEHEIRAELGDLYSTMTIEVTRNGKREWTAPAPATEKKFELKKSRGRG